jgi:hypothetical protein
MSVVKFLMKMTGQHVKNFKYVSCEISYENDRDIQQNWQNLLRHWEF